MRKKRSKGFGGLFAYEDRKAELATKPTSLDRLNKVIDWEFFRKVLQASFSVGDGTGPGRRPFDAVLMFKIMVLQRYYDLSDEQTEFQILDRLSFQRFLGLSLEDRVPDEKTIWLYKERLGSQGMQKLFDHFEAKLVKHGLNASRGKIVDASFVQTPRQHNRTEENARIKQGKPPEDWPEAKRRQKDVEARWAKKNQQSYFGYKNHVKVNRRSKLIERYKVSHAARHDSNVLTELLDEERDGEIYADSAYRSQEIQGELAQKKIRSRIHEKGYRGHELNADQRANNRQKSRIRARVEHIFGFQKNSLRAHGLRCIGLERATRSIGLSNLVYNLFRLKQLGYSM